MDDLTDAWLEARANVIQATAAAYSDLLPPLQGLLRLLAARSDEISEDLLEDLTPLADELARVMTEGSAKMNDARDRLKELNDVGFEFDRHGLDLPPDKKN